MSSHTISHPAKQHDVPLSMAFTAWKWGMFVGVVSGSLLGLPDWIIGAIPGFFFGFFIGGLAGLGIGFGIGLLTQQFFVPVSHRWLYRIIATGFGVLIGVLLVYILTEGLFDPILDMTRNQRIVLPTKIAGLFGLVISQRLVSLHIRNMTRAEVD